MPDGKVGDDCELDRDPIVSIIIPVYNDEAHVARAVESALNQTMKEVEVVVVDDGSTDNTPEVLHRYAGRIFAIRQGNGGPAAARNTGIAASRGEYLCFLDSDDSISPRKAEIQAALLDTHPEAGLCYGAYQEIDSRDGRLISVSRTSHTILDRTSGSFPPSFLIPAAMFRRAWLDKVGGFDEGLRRVEDFDLEYRLWAAGCRFLGHPELVFSWIVRGDSLSFTSFDASLVLLDLRVVEKYLAAMGEAVPEADRNRLRGQALVKVAACYGRGGRLSDAKTALTQAFQHDLSLLTEQRTYGRILGSMDPSYRFKSNETFPDIAAVWGSICAVIQDVCANEEGGSYKGKARPSKFALAFAISKYAFSKGRGWQARWWAMRSIIISPGLFAASRTWRRASHILLGPTLTRLPVFLLAALRRLRRVIRPERVG